MTAQQLHPSMWVQLNERKVSLTHELCALPMSFEAMQVGDSYCEIGVVWLFESSLLVKTSHRGSGVVIGIDDSIPSLLKLDLLRCFISRRTKESITRPRS
jgi:hypothetical protein